VYRGWSHSEEEDELGENHRDRKRRGEDGTRAAPASEPEDSTDSQEDDGEDRVCHVAAKRRAARFPRSSSVSLVGFLAVRWPERGGGERAA